MNALGRLGCLRGNAMFQIRARLPQPACQLFERRKVNVKLHQRRVLLADLSRKQEAAGYGNQAQQEHEPTEWCGHDRLSAAGAPEWSARGCRDWLAEQSQAG